MLGRIVALARQDGKFLPVLHRHFEPVKASIQLQVLGREAKNIPVLGSGRDVAETRV